ncbi:hypothetical protein QUB80_24035 [Chlorogloeopsis sp. ULAP01]|nr:hypothetical protein [Chlorogloeopsis sp. ULAP01]MDM9383759.1 hypothetical protein [Chlorogloeopsis sp. ULAP01]
MRETDPWVTILILAMSVIATAIGVYNFELFLNFICLIDTLPNVSKHCK